MHEHFGINKTPFSAAPNVDLIVKVPTFKEALIRTMACVSNGSGVALVIGHAGCGKSLLLEKLEQSYQDQHRVIKLSSPRFESRKELFQNLLYQMERPIGGDTDGELRLALNGAIQASEEHSQGILLLIDEAHLLCRTLIEELRMLTNLVRAGQPLVRLVLAGSPILEEKLNDPKLDALNQRITARTYLNPLTRDETHLLIISQLQICGRDGREVFSPAALDAAHELASGVPRTINQICHHAMWDTLRDGHYQVDEARVRRAWADLQCIPIQCESVSYDSASVIEFGSLDEAVQEEINSEPAVIEFSSEQEQAGISGFDPQSLVGDDWEPGVAETEEAPDNEEPTEEDNSSTQDLVEYVTPGNEDATKDCANNEVCSNDCQAGSSEEHCEANDLGSQVEVNNLMDELEQLDSPAAEDTTEANSNPLEEDFAEEETVADTYSNIVSDYNQRSVQVVSHELSGLDGSGDEILTTAEQIQFVATEDSVDAPPQKQLDVQTPSLPMESPLQDSQTYSQISQDQSDEIKLPTLQQSSDDRDMITVSRLEHMETEPRESVDSESEQPRATSTGSAMRVDLKQLFQQLRSTDNEA